MAAGTGFVGLGIMGRPMATNLARSFPVIGYDVDGSRFPGMAGVTRAATLAELARQCRAVCLSLPSAAVVEEVTIGSGGLAENLSARLAEKGVEFADAPVSGGEAGARTGALAIMVGASAGTFARCVPLLSSIGKSVVRVGEVGAGGVAKLVNNMIVASTFAVIAEGFALAARNGVDPQVLYDSIREGWAGSKVLDVSAAAIVARDYTPGGTIDMMEKDLGYARVLATEGRVPIPMTAAAHEIFVAGQAAGKGRSAQPAIIELWRDRGGGA
jgi:3-hydroxyisobutyrate dehydrogenase-like beta-hydroxyacid dehydrogenase